MDAHIAKGYAGRKMMVIGNGFDTQRFKSDLISRNETRQQLGLSKDSLVIGSIGRFNEYKDHRSLIRSAGEIASKNSKAFFLLAGRDVDSGNSSVMGWVDETGYSDRFFLLGERSDIGALLNAMDVFCLHSISEGFPNVLGEAMSVGLPAVVSDVGDAALVLGDAGVVVPPRDESELTKGLLKLINSSVENRVLLGKAARMRIEERYSMDSIQHQYDELYQRVLST